jgi:hypothetical protein
MAHLDGIEPWPMVNLVAVIEIHRLFDGTHVDPR